jgi:predicted  nucleic acid-binding Zn-ribbon protein
MDERALNEVRRLEELDAELAAGAARLRAFADEVESVRGRAVAIDTFFSTYTAEEERLQRATAEARAELERRRSELQRAEAALAAARSEEERAAASRAHARAREHLALAESRLARSLEDEAELERTAAAYTAEIPALEERARRVSLEVPDLPPQPTGLKELAEWASRARARLFIAIGQLEAQRERVIREAAELGTSLLGEPVYGATPEQVRKRVEALRP